MWIMHVDKFVKDHGLQQVRSHQIHESSTNQLHPEGLYSEEIFGDIGTPMRLFKFGYIELNTTIFHPVIFSNIVELRGIYKEVMAGRTYVKYDEELQDLVVCTKDDPYAETGYQYFMEIFPKIVFKPTRSNRRTDKINILNKYKNVLKITKCIVSPAGIRDLEETADGRFISEEINDIYRAVLSLSLAIPKEMSDHPIFNSVRYNLQMKVNAVVDHIFSITDGKKGYFQNKYMARKLAGGTRNVLVSAILEGSDPDDPRYLKPDESYVPLFQAMRMYDKVMKYWLRQLFFNNTIGNNTNNIPVIDPDTNKLTYIEISDIERNKYMTDDGLNDYINDFRNEDVRFKPVGIYDVNKKFYYLNLIYDNGDKIYMFRDKADLYTHVEETISSIKNIQYLKNLDSLNLPSDGYVILGSAATIAYGHDKINNDIDIIVTESVFNKILPLLTKTDKGYTDTATGTIDVNTASVLYSSFDEAYVHSRDIQGYRFLDIQGLRSFYENLYDIFKMEKHRPTLEWVRELSDTLFIDSNKIRPITIYEMFYITAYSCMQLGHNQKHLLSTRYPVAHTESIYPSKAHIVTTTPSRYVYMTSLLNDNLRLGFPQYPILHKESMDALALHHSWLENLTADFDGDMGNATGITSVEANEEIAAYMSSPISIVNTNGKLITGVNGSTIIPWVLSNMSRSRIVEPTDLTRFKPSLNRIKGINKFISLMPINQTILIGPALLTVLGLVNSNGLECLVNEYVFDILGKSGKFEYNIKTNTYTALDGWLRVYRELPNGEFTYDQLIYDTTRINSVLFLGPKIHYRICTSSTSAVDKQLAKIYEKQLRQEIK